MLTRLALIATLLPTIALGQTFDTSAGPVTVERMAGDLSIPWSLAFLPDGGKLVTERDGALLHFDRDWKRSDIAGLPEVIAFGQSGLFDVLVPRDFAETREIFLAYSGQRPGGASTILARATLNLGTHSLEEVRTLFQMPGGEPTGRHFGGRLLELEDGTLLMTLGDHGQRPLAQFEDVHYGKTVRVRRDGSIPDDNPFLTGPYLPEIYTTGHRNPQGLASDADGRIWTNAHGARGGDEVNLIVSGRNYGWPVISYGRHYSFLPIGEGVEKPGLEQPAHYWDPSIAPSGLMIYSGRLWSEWEGDLFVGSLKFDMISRLDRVGEDIGEEERLFQDAFLRIRDIREGPEGAIWFLSEGDDALYRITPAK